MPAPTLSPERQRRAMEKLIRYAVETGRDPSGPMRQAMRHQGFTVTEVAAIACMTVDQVGALLVTRPDE